MFSNHSIVVIFNTVVSSINIKRTYFPGINLAISAHLWPNNLCYSIMISSSSSEIGFLLIVGFKWLWYHSQHYFPVHFWDESDYALWSLAISPQFFVPCYWISWIITWSSSVDQGCFLFFILINLIKRNFWNFKRRGINFGLL